MDYFLALLLGLSIGSFLNVVIYRLPRKASLVAPGSCCPGCRCELKWRDKLPLVSFALLRGRCRYCHANISWRYPVVEALTALLFILIYQTAGWSAEALQLSVLAGLLIAAAEIDRQHRIVPNRLVLFGTLCGVGFLFVKDVHAMAEAFLPAAAALALLLLVRAFGYYAFGRNGIGMGDVKLAAMLSLHVGWEMLWALYLAAVLSALLGSAGIVSGRMHRTTRIPFAPFIAAGVLLHLAGLSPDLFIW